MDKVFGIILFVTGLILITLSKRIAKSSASSFQRNASSSSIQAISQTQWDSPYMLMIGRIGVIIWGVVMILAAYVTIFGTINLTPQTVNYNQNTIGPDNNESTTTTPPGTQ